MGVLASPRRRRRALWVGAGVLVAGVVAAAIVALPGVHKPHETLRPGGTVPTTVKEARVTPARRHAIDALFDAFVRTAVERHDVARAWPLVPAAFLALIVLVPLGAGLVHVRRTRRAWRDYNAQPNRGT